MRSAPRRRSFFYYMQYLSPRGRGVDCMQIMILDHVELWNMMMHVLGWHTRFSCPSFGTRLTGTRYVSVVGVIATLEEYITGFHQVTYY